MLLEPLVRRRDRRLIDRLLGGIGSTRELRERIRNAAEGNPLFVEQMLAMVARVSDRATSSFRRRSRRCSPHGSTSSPRRARRSLERGAVEGQVFHRGAVQALAPDDPGLRRSCSRSCARSSSGPTAPTLPGDDAFRFRHLLIRDAAYEALPKASAPTCTSASRRGSRSADADLVELDEIFGYHLEQAALYREELGEPSPGLARRAALRLGAAGRRAGDRQDIHAASRLFRRSLALLPEDDPDAVAMLPDFGRVLYTSGELDEAERVLTYATEHGSPDVAATAFFLWAFMRGHARGVSLIDLEQEVRDALRAYEADGGSDDSVLAAGYHTLANVLFWNGRLDEQLRMSERALVHAQRAGHPVFEEWSRAQIGAGMHYGSTPWTEFEAFAHAGRAEDERKGRLTAVDWNIPLAVAASNQGRFDEARRLFAEQAASAIERGMVFEHLTHAQHPGVLELLAGDYEAAETILRVSWDGLGDRGEQGFRSTIGTLLAEALVRGGRVDEALAIAEESERIGSDDDWVTVAQAELVRGMVASARGDHVRAVQLGRAAVDRACRTEDVMVPMHVWLGYAELLAAAGRDDEAREALGETLRLAELKGSTVSEDRARALLDTLQEPLEEAPR